MSYLIEVNLISGLPQEPYDNGHSIGVIGHSTAVFGDTPYGERNYELTHWQDAFVHFFVGAGKIEQVADTNYVCYGAGHTANHLGYVQVELCQTEDAYQFIQDYAMYVWLLAKLLYDRNIEVIDDITLMSHAQVSAKWGETDHEDPIEYLASHGKMWANVVADVTREYQEMETVKLDVAVLLYTKDDYWAGTDVATKNGNCAMFVRPDDHSVTKDAMNAKKLIVIGGPTVNHPNEVLLSGKDKYETVAAVKKYLG